MTGNSEFADDKETVGETVGSERVTDRRKLFRRLAALAGLGITGALLSQDMTGLLPRVSGTDMYNGSVGFFIGSAVVGDNSHFFWDDGNYRLGINQTAPAATLDVGGADTTNPPTSGIQVSTPSYPQILLNVSNAGANAGPNNKIWRLIGRRITPPGTTYNNVFQIETLDDSYANEVAAMQITRSGTSISNVCFPNGYVGIGTSSPAHGIDLLSDFSAKAAAPGVGLVSAENTDTSATYDVGVYGQSDGPNGNGVKGVSSNTTTSTGGQGVLGIVENQAPPSLLAGVMGLANNGYGVYGNSLNAWGVYGISSSAIGAGVKGFSDSGYGVYGVSTSGNGVEGISDSGIGGFFQGTPAIYANGNVGIGTTSPSTVLHVAQDNSDRVRFTVQNLHNVAGQSQSALMEFVGGNYSQIWLFANDVGTNGGNNFGIFGGGSWRLFIDGGTGNVGIGTTSPSTMLHLAQDNSDRVRFTVENLHNVTGQSQSALMEFVGANQTWLFSSDVGGNGGNNFGIFGGGSWRLFIDGGTGHVGIGTTNPSHLIQLSGGAYSDGTTWNPASSIRWKENITPLTDGVETLRQLHPVAYNYKKTPGKRTMGFIAEEVGKVLPTVVDWDPAETGYAEGYDQTAIVALAVEAVKEQQTKIEHLEVENNTLRDRIENQQQRIEALEHKLAAN